MTITRFRSTTLDYSSPPLLWTLFELQFLKPFGDKRYLFRLDLFDAYPQPVLLQQFTQPLSIDEIDRWSAVPRSLQFGITSKRPSGDEDPLVAATGHGTSEVPNDCRTDAPPGIACIERTRGSSTVTS